MIGIVTFQDTTNFGAMLQTYALQQSLFLIGEKNEIIRYNNEYLSKNERPSKITEVRSPRELLRYLLLNSTQKRKYQKFVRFFKNNVSSSKEIFDKNTIKNSNKIYNHFLSGSDQIWNAEITEGDFNYLLRFADKNKKLTSYASSMGGYLIEERYSQQYKECLSRYDFISMREQDGIEQIKKLFGLDATLVVDPTLLLTQEEWDEVANRRLVEEDYILVYFIDRTKENFDYIRMFAKAHNCKVIYLQDFIRTEFGMMNIRDASPEDFISYIKYAKYVFTGSFHGLCFCLIYNKSFYMTISPAKKGKGE